MRYPPCILLETSEMSKCAQDFINKQMLQVYYEDQKDLMHICGLYYYQNHCGGCLWYNKCKLTTTLNRGIKDLWITRFFTKVKKQIKAYAILPITS